MFPLFHFICHLGVTHLMWDRRRSNHTVENIVLHGNRWKLESKYSGNVVVVELLDSICNWSLCVCPSVSMAKNTQNHLNVCMAHRHIDYMRKECHVNRTTTHIIERNFYDFSTHLQIIIIPNVFRFWYLKFFHFIRSDILSPRVFLLFSSLA